MPANIKQHKTVAGYTVTAYCSTIEHVNWQLNFLMLILPMKQVEYFLFLKKLLVNIHTMRQQNHLPNACHSVRLKTVYPHKN
jgi:hypothetical protein